MVLLALAACAVCGAALWVALMLRGSGHVSGRPQAGLARPLAPSREEDRVRPARDVTGERIWLEQDELLWHEIVCWPARRAAEDGRAPARRRRTAG